MADKSKGNGANKNQTAQKRAESNAAANSQQLKNPRTCHACGGSITTLGQLETVVVVDRKQRKVARHKGGCPTAA